MNDPYASRTVGLKATIRDRVDPVVHSNGSHARVKSGLTQEQLDGYARDGFIVLKSLFSQGEVDVFLEEMRLMADDPVLHGRDEIIREPGTGIVRSIFMVHRLSDLFRRLAADGRILDIARQIVGSEAYIHQSRINLKPGFDGKEFYWHSDFETWHVEDGMPRMRAVSCSITLTENNEFNGSLMLIPGSHRHYLACEGQTPENHYKQSLRRQEYGTPTHDQLNFLVDRSCIRSAAGPAGSAVFFDCNTMHGSNSNISPFPRSNIFFVYNSVENRLCDPFSGQKPRPEFIATREGFAPIVPAE